MSKFRCKYIIQVPSGRREHWLLIKIILTKIQTKECDVSLYVDSKNPSCVTEYFDTCIFYHRVSINRYNQYYATNLPSPNK